MAERQDHRSARLDEKPSTEEIRQRMDATRHSIAEKVDAIEKQVEERVLGTVDKLARDVQEKVDAVSRRVDDTVELVAGTVESSITNASQRFDSAVTSLSHGLDLRRQVEARPLAALACSVAAGLVTANWLTRRPLVVVHHARPEARPSAVRALIAGLAADLLSALGEGAFGQLAPHTQQAVHQALTRSWDDWKRAKNMPDEDEYPDQNANLLSSDPLAQDLTVDDLTAIPQDEWQSGAGREISSPLTAGRSAR